MGAPTATFLLIVAVVIGVTIAMVIAIWRSAKYSRAAEGEAARRVELEHEQAALRDRAELLDMKLDELAREWDRAAEDDAP